MLVMVDFRPDFEAYIPRGFTECITRDSRSKPIVKLKGVNLDQLTPRSFRVYLMVRGDDKNGRLQTLKIAWNRLRRRFPGLPFGFNGDSTICRSKWKPIIRSLIPSDLS
jgi:hypothetical protein